MHFIKNIRRATCLLLLSAITLHTQAQKIRIACVGNSITYGARLENRIKNNYPAQLQNMLGDQYEVKNFGVSGRTLLRKGNLPYWKEAAFREALDFKPDIVTILLGTNDSKAINRPYLNEFVGDFTDLIDSFRALPSHPRIVLLLPLPSFAEDSNAIYDPVIKDQIIPLTRQVAYQTGTELLNLYSLFIDKTELLADKVHPTSLGATVIARRLYESITEKTDPHFNIFAGLQNFQRSNFYGYACADFKFEGRNCKIVQPKKAAPGHPWIWRARFFGHEPQNDIALLERGFHVVYCDVAEWYGNKSAVKIWNDFYARMQQFGLSKKVALEGMSRGGIYVYNWALANPGKVACIYADAPVLDFRSWPGGKGKSLGSQADWEIFKQDYSLTEDQAATYHNNPLDNATRIARLGIPLLHVVGDADEVVPIAENTLPFEEKIKAAGGNIVVIHKPGVNHHPHSLPNPTLITDFILRSTGYKTNFATIPAPAAEYRSAAGWTEGKDWWAQKENIDSLLLAEKKPDILFLGNSITQGLGGHRTYVTYKPGFRIFDSVFAGYSWECAGISGDRTENVLWRLEHGAYKDAKPGILVVTIGVNNFIDDDSPEEIAAGIFAIADYVRRQMPSTHLILTGLLPTGLQKDSDRRKKYEKIQSLLAQHRNTGYQYLPLSDVFIQTDGSLSNRDYSGDGIHLVAEGYRKWALALQPVINSFLHAR